MASRTVFVADMHLRPGHRPGQSAALWRFVSQVRALGAQRLIFLGDTFNFWFERGGRVVGDYDAVLTAFATLAADGVTMDLVSGNRDRLLPGLLSRAGLRQRRKPFGARRRQPPRLQLPFLPRRHARPLHPRRHVLPARPRPRDDALVGDGASAADWGRLGAVPRAERRVPDSARARHPALPAVASSRHPVGAGGFFPNGGGGRAPRFLRPLPHRIPPPAHPRGAAGRVFAHSPLLVEPRRLRLVQRRASGNHWRGAMTPRVRANFKGALPT